MSGKDKKRFLNSHEFFLIIVDILLMLVLTVMTKGLFLSSENLIDMVTGYAAFGIMAAGVLVVIISGGIDISFMAVATIAQYLMGAYMLKNGGNFFIIIAIALAVGAVLGALNALLVHTIKAPTMIITIATMNIFYGILMWATRGVKLHNFPAWFASKTPFAKIAIPIGFLVLTLCVTAYILRFTKTGRRVYAIGDNLEAARRTGVNVLKTRMFVYCFAGVTAALGSIVQCYLIQQVALNDMVGSEMDVIAMVVLGGVALSGGKGSVGGTALGILLVAVLSNGLILIGVSSYWQDLCIGLVILISFCITGYRTIQNRKKELKGGKLEDVK